MRKVGIMTLYHKTYNYGAKLQAYALQRVVEQLGFQCELIDFQWMNKRSLYGYERINSSIKEKFKIFSNSIPHSNMTYTPMNIFEANNVYDIFLCGSDQIWGCENSMPVYNTSHLTLDFVDNNKLKIAYAVSMGGSRIKEYQIPAIKNPIKKLDFISVREESAIPFVSEISGKEISCDLDPTLLIGKKEWESFVFEDDSKDYILLYALKRNDALKDIINLLSEKECCGIKTISYTQFDSIGPKEFINLIANSKYVITDSYHGTIFSIIFNKEFFSIYSDHDESDYSRNIRVKDLLEKFNISERYIDWNSNFHERLSQSKPINYIEIEKILLSEREKSLRFLKMALSSEKKVEKKESKAGLKLDNPYDMYLEVISSEISKEGLVYEKRLLEKEIEYEKYIEYQERQISLWKSMALIEHCKGDANSLLTDLEGDVIVYGIGELGREICQCLGDNLIAIIDKYSLDTEFEGRSIYRIDDKRLKDLIINDDITVVVTPTWDIDNIENEIKSYFPNLANIICVDDLLVKIKERRSKAY